MCVYPNINKDFCKYQIFKKVTYLASSTIRSKSKAYFLNVKIYLDIKVKRYEAPS